MRSWALLRIFATLKVYAALSNGQTLTKRSSNDAQSIIESERYAPEWEDYEVSLAKYGNRYYQKEYQGADQSTLDKIQYKLDMLSRKSSAEIMDHANKQTDKQVEVWDRLVKTRNKYSNAKLKEKTYEMLANKIRSGYKVPKKDLDDVYYRHLRAAGASTSSASSSSSARTSRLADKFSGLMSGKKSKDKKGRDLDSTSNDAYMQHKAALMVHMPASLFDIAKGRKKVEQIHKDISKGYGIYDKRERQLLKEDLREKAVLDLDAAAAQSLAEEYTHSAARHRLEKDRLQGWYNFLDHKRRTWVEKSEEYQDLHIPNHSYSRGKEEEEYF